MSIREKLVNELAMASKRNANGNLECEGQARPRRRNYIRNALL